MRRSGFTLIEVLLVIAIIVLLASLAVPAMEGFIAKGNDLKCQQNLRNLFVMISAAAVDNENRYPKIEIDVEKPAHSGDPSAKPLLETLNPYGCTEKNLECPADLAGPNWNKTKKTSYMWQPMVEDELTNAVTVYMPRGAFPGQLNRLRLLQDWDLVHNPAQVGMRKRMHVLYADGQVKPR